MATGAPGASGVAVRKIVEESGKELGYGTASIHHLSREGDHVRGMGIRQNSVPLVSTLYLLIKGREEETGGGLGRRADAGTQEQKRRKV